MASDQTHGDNDKAKKRTSILSISPPQRPSTDYDYETFLPIDHGFAWVICFASFMTSYLTGLSASAISILFLEIVDFYRTSYSVASLGMTSIVLTFSIMSVVSAYLVPVLGERYLTLLAGVIYASCSVCVFFSTTIVGFIVLSAVKGAAAGSIVIPVVSMLAKFFKERLSLAMSISSSGFCVASITAPALIRDLYHEYGFRGTYLILAGVELHMLVAGLLLRPLSWFRRRKRLMILLHIKGSTYPKIDVKQTQSKHSTHATHASNVEIERVKTESDLDLFLGDKKQSSTTITTATEISTFRSSQKDDKGKGQRASNTRALYEYPTSSTESSTDFNSISFYPISRRSRAKSERRSHELNRNVFIPMIMSHGTVIMSRSSSIWGHEARRSTCAYGLRKSSRDNGTTLSDGVDGSVFSGKYKGSVVSRKSKLSGRRTIISGEAGTLPETETPTSGPTAVTFAEKPLVKTLSFFQNPKIQHISRSFGELRGAISASSVIRGGWRECCCFRALFHSTMMTHGAFVMLLWASIPGSVNQYIVQYLPTIAELKGATKEEAALIVTICGAVDLYSRIFVGYLADKYWMRPTQIVSLAQFFLGIICHCNIFIDDFNTLLVMALAMGLFLGTRSTLLPVMIVELLGVDMMPKALAIITMTTTFTSAFHGIFLSSMIEAINSIRPALHYVGAALMLSALGILMTIPLILEDEDEPADSQADYIFQPTEPRRLGSPN